ncbi:hypothetical protein ACFX2B_024932 [Malus domestica]
MVAEELKIQTALHLAAWQGHVEIVKTLLGRDPQLARRNDKKGQTALHMAVKGVSSEVVRLIVDADPAIVMLPDKFGAIEPLREIERDCVRLWEYAFCKEDAILGFCDQTFLMEEKNPTPTYKSLSLSLVQKKRREVLIMTAIGGVRKNLKDFDKEEGDVGSILLGHEFKK